MLKLGNEEQLISGQNAHCEGNTSVDFPLYDVVDIVEFFVHAMGLLESELTEENLAQVGCHPGETEVVLLLLERKHLREKVKAKEVIVVSTLLLQVTP